MKTIFDIRVYLSYDEILRKETLSMKLRDYMNDKSISYDVLFSAQDGNSDYIYIQGIEVVDVAAVIGQCLFEMPVTSIIID